MKFFRQLVERIGERADLIGPPFVETLRQVATLAHPGDVLREFFEWLHDDTAQHQPRNHGNDQPCKREEEQCAVDRILAKRGYPPRRTGDQGNQRRVKQIGEDAAAHDFVLQ